jgi:hypothetical protein
MADLLSRRHGIVSGSWFARASFIGPRTRVRATCRGGSSRGWSVSQGACRQRFEIETHGGVDACRIVQGASRVADDDSSRLEGCVPSLAEVDVAGGDDVDAWRAGRTRERAHEQRREQNCRTRLHASKLRTAAAPGPQPPRCGNDETLLLLSLGPGWLELPRNSPARHFVATRAPHSATNAHVGTRLRAYAAFVPPWYTSCNSEMPRRGRRLLRASARVWRGLYRAGRAVLVRRCRPRWGR